MGIQILKLKEVVQKTSLCRATVYQMMAAGTFPKSISLGPRSVGWIESEVEQWLQDRIDQRDQENAA